MTKEQFLDKWKIKNIDCIADIDAVIATEIAKVQLEKQNAMVQEKQLRELFKYIESNWDVCVSQMDKTDIKRIFGDVLCENIMNDTLHKVKAEPALNPIADAYEMGEKIRYNYWRKNSWIKKHSDSKVINQNGVIAESRLFDFIVNPEKWELHPEPAKPFDKDRFERMFRAVVASGRTESYEQDFLATNICLEKLDAYYATKEGGNNG